MQDRTAVIVGGGIIGTSIAWQLIRRGFEITLLDRGEIGGEASRLAAGMLAADAEVGFEELELYGLSRESLDRWPAFARLLEAESGTDVDYRAEGTVVVADDRDSAVALRRVYDFQREQGIDVRWLTGAEALELEPFLAPRLAAAVFAPSDHQVDNRRVVSALRTVLESAGSRIVEQAEVVSLSPDETKPGAVTKSGDQFTGDVVVLAAGAWSRQMGGIAPEFLPPVRPVKGQIMELEVEAPFGLSYVVRGPSAYLAPKSDDRVIVGATSEEMGFDKRVTAGGIFRILEGAWEIVPGIYDLPLIAAEAGLRPGSRDNEPIIGWTGAPGVYCATGHYRHGIVQAPVTAEEAALEIDTGTESEWLARFRPDRFRA